EVGQNEGEGGHAVAAQVGGERPGGGGSQGDVIGRTRVAVVAARVVGGGIVLDGVAPLGRNGAVGRHAFHVAPDRRPADADLPEQVVTVLRVDGGASVVGDAAGVPRRRSEVVRQGGAPHGAVGAGRPAPAGQGRGGGGGRVA